jgi:multidrug efflux system membrane fusion protein
MPVVPGIVEKIHFSEGDRVKAGAPLVSLKTEDFVLRSRQADAGMAAAQAQFDAATLAFDRTRGLRGKEAVSQGQLDQVEAGYKGAKAGLDNAKVMLDMVHKALRDTTVYAPYDALVVRRLISEGESALTMPPSPLAVIEQTALLDLKLQVPAAHLASLAEGTPLVVRFPATGQEVKAVVKRVVPSANPGSRTFTVIVELPNEDGALKAGLYAEARLDNGTRAPEAAR